MRLFLAVSLVAALAVPSVAAQATQGQGTVEMVLAPERLDLTPERPLGETKAWINATVQCQSGYSPSPVSVRPNVQSLRDEDGEQVWTVEPNNIQLPFSEAGGAGRYEARVEQVVRVTMRTEPEPRSTRISFDLIHSSSLIYDCSPLGRSSWSFDREPTLVVTMVVDPGEPLVADAGSQGAAANLPEPASVPSEIGRISGSSRVPGEAFGALLVFGSVVGAYATFEWRVARRP
jgi:hypothetical protein